MKKQITLTTGLVLLAHSALGQTVELKSIDQANTLTGDVVGYDGELLTLDTPTGIIQVPSRRLRCVSADCPTDIAWADLDRTLSLSYAVARHRDLVDKLAKAYFASEGIKAATGPNASFTLRDINSAALTVNFVREDDVESAADRAITAYRFDNAIRAEYDDAIAWATEPEPKGQIIAANALAVVVGPDVEVAGITLEDLARVFSGALSNWSELGGADLPILPLKRQVDAQATRDLEEIVMKPAGLAVSETILTVASDEDIVSTINELPGSIALVDVAAGALSSKLGILGPCGTVIGPSEFAIKSGDYPLIRPLLVEAVSEESPGPLTALFDFAATEPWQSGLTDDAFINRAIVVQPPEEKAARIAAILSLDLSSGQQQIARAFVETLFEATPLSVTLQDNAITETVAARNRDSFLRLRDAIINGAFDNTEMIFAGFSGQGDVLGLLASENSAQEILSAFLKFAPDLGPGNPQGITYSSVGYGSIAPVSCHDGPLSSSDGNRVEIWIKQAGE